MNANRLELHWKLLDLMTNAYLLERESDPDVPDFSENVYFQPPSSVLMNYPAIVYERSSADMRHADNALYLHKCRYTVTVIDADPDSPIPRMVAALPMCRSDRHFYTDNLNHDTFEIYY